MASTLKVDRIETPSGVGNISFQQPISGDGSQLTGVGLAVGGGTVVAGDVLYYNGTAWTRLPKGTAAQILKMNAGATAPEWGASSGGISEPASSAAGDILYYNGTEYTRLAKGTAGQQLAINAGATAPEWVTASGGGAWSVKASGSVSDVASLNITGITKTTQVILSNAIPATDGTIITSRISQDNGSTWDSSSSYRYDLQWARDNSNSVNDSGSGGGAATYIRMGLLTGNAGGENESITYTIYSPANTTKHTTMTFQGSIIESDAASLCVSTTGSAYYSANTNAINGLQFLYTTGNISADYVVLELN